MSLVDDDHNQSDEDGPPRACYPVLQIEIKQSLALICSLLLLTTIPQIPYQDSRPPARP